MNANLLKKIIIPVGIFIFLILSFQKFQQLSTIESSDHKEQILKATIIKVEKEEKTQLDNREYTTQFLKISVDSGALKGTEVIIETAPQPKYQNTTYSVSEKVLVGYLDTGVGDGEYYIIGYSRTAPLVLLFLLFIAATVFIARKKGIASLLGMAVSMTLLILFILPAIAQGRSPLLTSVIGAGSLIPILFYISHGINRKTTAAVIGTAVTFCITALLALIFVNWAHLTGISFEEVETLLYIHDGNFDLQGILLAGILLGVLGVIDDVAITQASLVEELFSTNKKLSKNELIQRAMNVGRDHIGSVVNTLILVYVGGALTTLLLFTQFPRPFEVLINSEIVAIPIIVALIGSIGLIVAVPITTFISAWIVTKER